MKMPAQDRIAEAILGVLFTGLLISYGWVVESNQAIAFGHGRTPRPHVTMVTDPTLVTGFAAFVFLVAATFSALMAKRVGLNVPASLMIGAVVLLHPLLYFFLK